MSFKNFLQNNINKFVIDLNEYPRDIDLPELCCLLEFTAQTPHLGYVVFKPKHYQDHSEIGKVKEAIENQLAQNNSSFRTFTSDKIICKLNRIAFNWFGNPYPAEFNAQLKLEWNSLEKKGWKMEEQFEQSENISILFVNHQLRQAVLSFTGIKMDEEHFLNEDKAKQAVLNLMLDSALAINILNETINSIGDLNYFLSFTGYSFGALYAEQSCLLCRKLKPELANVQSVTFDSPGSLELLAYVCRDFNLETTLTELEAINFVTYISAPNFVNSFGSHVGKIKYLCNDKTELVKFKEEMNKNDSFIFHFRTLTSLLGNSLNEIFDHMNNESYSVVMLTEQNNSKTTQIKEQNKIEFTSLTMQMHEQHLKYSYIFLTMAISIINKTKKLPDEDFDASDYKRYQVCEINYHEDTLSTDSFNSIDYFLNELNEKDFNQLIKSSEPEFISLIKQMSLLKSKFTVKHGDETYIKSISRDFPIEAIKCRYERLLDIEQYLEKSKIGHCLSKLSLKNG